MTIFYCVERNYCIRKDGGKKKKRDSIILRWEVTNIEVKVLMLKSSLVTKYYYFQCINLKY